MINCLIDLCKLLSNKKLHDQIELKHIQFNKWVFNIPIFMVYLIL